MSEILQVNGQTTEQFGSSINVKAQSIRVRLCQTGSYFGVKPQKLPNGRLLWPQDAKEYLLSSREVMA